MNQFTLSQMLRSVACLSVGFASIRLFSLDYAEGLSWIFFPIGLTMISAAIGILLRRLWSSVIVGLVISYFVVTSIVFVWK